MPRPPPSPPGVSSLSLFTQTLDLDLGPPGDSASILVLLSLSLRLNVCFLSPICVNDVLQLCLLRICVVSPFLGLHGGEERRSCG